MQFYRIRNIYPPIVAIDSDTEACPLRRASASKPSLARWLIAVTQIKYAVIVKAGFNHTLRGHTQTIACAAK